ncbi:hypothetical protein AGMMS49949_06500 [Alphaproteobacteria bacterium]|nr:hypothetical protein AGMMS49949_06500 [Alphaproteobacteria bacterium]GHS98369.1 hypothetical protein AGMMS50296_5980 [Alphaproteobacteria bacterium]
MNEQELQFFENNCELPAKELLEGPQEDRTKWVRSLKPHQFAYILAGKTDAKNLSFQEQKQFLLSHCEDFQEEYLVSHFASGKSQALVKNIFDSTFGDQPPLVTSDRLIQLMALYRFQKESLQSIQSFQKLQRRGSKLYKLVTENPKPEQSFEDFATLETMEKILGSLHQKNSKEPSDLFAESQPSAPSPDLPLLYCQHIAKTDHSIFFFFRKPRERVFVTKPQSSIGDHRYKPTDIILKFSRSCEHVSITSYATIGVLLAEKIASAFLKIPVQYRPVTHFVSFETLKAFVQSLLYQPPQDHKPYAFDIQFKPPNACEDVLLKISMPLLDFCLGDLAKKYEFSLERLEDLKELTILFESQKVTLLFHQQGKHFVVFFTSKALSFETRSRLYQWGENFGVSLLQK